MNISIRHIGVAIIELTIEESGATITSDITNLSGFVDFEFIENLENIANELKFHNMRCKRKATK